MELEELACGEIWWLGRNPVQSLIFAPSQNPIIEDTVLSIEEKDEVTFNEYTFI